MRVRRLYVNNRARKMKTDAICLGETFFGFVGLSLLIFLFARFVRFIWRNKLDSDSYKRFRLKALYVMAIMTMMGAIFSVFLGTDC